MESEQSQNILYITDSTNFNHRDSTKSFQEKFFLRASLGFGIKNGVQNYQSEETTSTNGCTPRGSLDIRGSLLSVRASQGICKRRGSEKDEDTLSDNSQNLDSSTSEINQTFYLRGSLGYNQIKKSTFQPSEPILELIREETAENLASKNSTPLPQKIISEKYTYLGFLNEEGKRDGFGVCYYSNGDKYFGNWLDDKKEGWGRYYIKREAKTFSGEFRANSIDGFVEYTNKNGVTHQGVMRNQKFVNKEAMIIYHPKYELQGIIEFNAQINKLIGIATIKYSNGTVYEGETLENNEFGWGITKRQDNFLIRGQKNGNDFNSYCEIEYPDGSKYFGWFLNNKREGVGITLSNDGVYSIGRYTEDNKNGGFLSCCRGEAKFDIFLYGFHSKTVDGKEQVINYINLVYPEFKWLWRTNNQNLAQMICEAKERVEEGRN
jgi:hypothetical protein